MIITDLEALPSVMREPNKDILGSKTDSDLIDLKREVSLNTLNNDLTIILDITDSDVYSQILVKYEGYLNTVLSSLQLMNFYFQQIDIGDSLSMFRYEKYEIEYNDAKKSFRQFNVDTTPYMNATTTSYNLYRT